MVMADLRIEDKLKGGKTGEMLLQWRESMRVTKGEMECILKYLEGKIEIFGS